MGHMSVYMVYMVFYSDTTDNILVRTHQIEQ